MVEYITRDELRGFAGKIAIAEQTNLLKQAMARSPAGSTFLSHSSKDSELVVGAVRVLQSHGGLVYVDEVDPNMPPYTSKETAKVLKTRIKQASRFVLLASTNSKESRWVPWELGVADGYKELSTIALFPAVENTHDTSWTSWEYLGLYRRIVRGRLENYEKEVWMVLDEKDNTATELRKWLTGT